MIKLKNYAMLEKKKKFCLHMGKSDQLLLLKIKWKRDKINVLRGNFVNFKILCPDKSF